jgi:dihydrolipoamide dehydrogenase
MEKFDIVIIGGGPGGYVAAIRASQLGLNVALVEKQHLGGVCLNWGCIPTKALLRCSEINHLLHNLDEYGFSVKDIKFDFKKIIKRSRDVASKLSQGISFLMKKHKVEVFNSFGMVNGKNAVRLLDEKGKTIEDLQAKNIIIATGARARILPNLEPDGKFIWSYKEAMVPEELPKSLLVVGSGAIGMEFASFYNGLGCNVTIVEMAENILPVEDREISQIVRKEFEKRKVDFFTNATVSSIVKGKKDVEVAIKQNDKITKVKVDRVIVAAGIVANVENIGLESTAIELDRGHIKTDAYLETAEKGIYAIGDVVGAPWLAHKASHEAVICAEKIAGKNPRPLKIENIPGCTYCTPQIASIGLTEEKAKEAGHKIRVGRFPFSANGKAIAMGEETGLVKVIFEEQSGELLGAHMVGSEVTEMVQGFSIAKTIEATEEDLMHTIFPHPTLSEMMHEAVLEACGKSIHI